MFQERDMQQLDEDLVRLRTRRTALGQALRGATESAQRCQLQQELDRCQEAYISLLERKVDRLTIRCRSLRMLLDECARGYRSLRRGGPEDAAIHDET